MPARSRLLILLWLVPMLLGAPAGAWDTAVPLGGLGGKMLAASPKMTGGFFAETVILVCRHDAAGAFGLVVNKRAGHAGEEQGSTPGWPLHVGGPVEPQLLFMLMSAEAPPPGAMVVEGGYAVANPEPYLTKGGAAAPRRGMLVMGYSGWAPGQLEAEMARGDWVPVEADEELVFGAKDDAKWRRAINKRGVDL